MYLILLYLLIIQTVNSQTSDSQTVNSQNSDSQTVNSQTIIKLSEEEINFFILPLSSVDLENQTYSPSCFKEVCNFECESEISDSDISIISENEEEEIEGRIDFLINEVLEEGNIEYDCDSEIISIKEIEQSIEKVEQSI